MINTQDIQTLQQREERYRFAIEGATDGLWDWNILTSEMYYSPKWKDILGYSDDELENCYETWESHLHPEDKEQLFLDIKMTHDEQTKHYEFSYRLKHKNGHWVWINTRGQNIFDENAKVIRMIGSNTDITEKKVLEQELEKSYGMLHKLTENIPGAIYQYRLYPDGKSKFTYASKGIENVYELSPKDVVKDANIIFTKTHKDDVNMFEASVLESVKTMKEWNIKYRVNLPKKGLRWLHGKSIPEKLEDGSVLWNGVISDITEQKRIKAFDDKNAEILKMIASGEVASKVYDEIALMYEARHIGMRCSLLELEDGHLMHGGAPSMPKEYCDAIHGLKNGPSVGSCGTSTYLGQRTLVEDIDTDSKWSAIKHVALPHGMRSCWSEPIKNSSGKVLGAFGMYYDHPALPNYEESEDLTSAARLASIVMERDQSAKHIYHQAHHDSLTGLPNRILFNDRLEQAIKTAKHNKTNIALLFIDLDHFKKINDSLGHDVGDEILKITSKRLDEIIRVEDTVARLGGDEFIIIIEDLSQVKDASLIANKILDSLSKAIVVDDNTLYVSCSIGISLYPDDGVSTQNLFKFADSAMYKAKDEGRNNYQYYNSTMTELAFEKVVMETSLRTALKNEEFVVYYQPQVSGVTNKLIGMEALVRWQHPTMGLVSPAKFIPLAESTGLIVEIDRYVMKTAMTQLSLWYKAGFNPGQLAMNLAVKQLKQNDFIDTLQRLIKETECKPEWLELEVTEGQIMTNPDEAIKILQQISDIGIELAIDDFGTGYSSLAYLKRLPIDKLKIDQTFVKNIPNDSDDSAIAKAVIALGQSLNLKVIAEGVETKKQRDFLVDNGCENIQGYFYSRPVPTNKIERMLEYCS